MLYLVFWGTVQILPTKRYALTVHIYYYAYGFLPLYISYVNFDIEFSFLLDGIHLVGIVAIILVVKYTSVASLRTECI